jgi:hypothetical protein
MARLWEMPAAVARDSIVLAWGQRRDRDSKVTKASRVIDAVAAHQPDSGTVLESEDAPAVDLLFVNPSRRGGRLALQLSSS